MPIQRFSLNQYSIASLLTWISNDNIAIPEIQRPFVWSAAEVRDFLDSLYRGYPVGYLITWWSSEVRLKDGTQPSNKRILIDGQQRVMAILTTLLGQDLVNKNYKRTRVTIAFHPQEDRFEVANAAILKDPGWIPDIAIIFAPGAWMSEIVDGYCEANPNSTKRLVDERVRRLDNIKNNPIGFIELNEDLDIETVAEIFVRINSQGVSLNAADFAMSKMAASERYNGHHLRKCIDYFCHLAIAPEAYGDLAEDREFAKTEYFRAMRWLKGDKEDLYDPSYTDMLRVAFTMEFERGRLEDLVALLSGRNFESRTFEEAIAEESFQRLDGAIRSYMKEDNFKKFVMILRSAGFVNASMIRSQNTINFAYILYLKLRELDETPEKIEKLVRRWFAMSVLTGRYTGSPETAFGVDIRNISTQGASQYLASIERAELSNAFWNAGLPQQMDTSVASSPYFNVFLASQVKGNAKGFLSRDLTVLNLLEGQRHIHHVFPRSFLQKEHGLTRGRYNQIANYVVMQSEINITIGARPPSTYFSELLEQCKSGITRYGGITEVDQLRENLDAHCIPQGMESSTVEGYDEFLKKRRSLMAVKIRDYYKSL